VPFQDSDLLGWTLYGGMGTLVGVALVLLLLIFVPGPARKKIRWIVLSLVLHLILLALRLPFPEDSSIRATLKLIALFLLYTSLGLSLLLLLTSSRLSQVFIRPLPKIFLDIAHGVVYIVAFLMALGSAGVRPAELFAGSALLTAVIGLSLRDTLGNLFAGLAIQAQRPFELGDWIQFNQDTNQIGQVAEINWRATTVVTPDRVEIVVPNSLLAQAPIINYSQPEAPTRRVVYVNAPYSAAPERVKEIILAALVDAPGVLTSPAPTAMTSGFDDRGVQFCVRFFIGDFSTRGKMESVVRDRIWYGLARHGIDIPVPPRSVRVQKEGKGALARKRQRRLARHERALECVDFFDRLPDGSRRQLAGHARIRRYAAQEAIIRQGEKGDKLFILLRGAVVVTVASPGEQPVEVARLQPGSFFGEMAALTGEPRRATVRAARECRVLVIGKSALARVFASAPELAEHVSQTLARRQAELNTRMSMHAPPPPHVVEEHGRHLLRLIKEFFSM
jgi:small-conductance mechanosensitive channel/CRP-like cAMP-binding protein